MEHTVYTAPEMEMKLRKAHVQLTDLEEEIGAAEAELSGLRDCTENQKERIGDLANWCGFLQRVIDEGNVERERLQKQNGDLEAWCAHLQKIIDDYAAETEQLRKRSSELEEQCAQLRAEIDRNAAEKPLQEKRGFIRRLFAWLRRHLTN